MGAWGRVRKIRDHNGLGLGDPVVDSIHMKQIGMFLAGVWFVAHGLIPLIDLHFKGLSLIMSGLAIAAGVLLILRR